MLTSSAWAVDYVKVGSDADLTNGTYLIVYEDGALAFNGGLETLDASQNTIAVTIADGKIASDATVDAASFTIDVTAGTILSASGFYIGQTSDANGLKQSTDAYTNAISIDADGNAVIVASGKPYLRYNANSGQERFRYFKSSTYANQKPIALYKKEGSAPVVTVAAPTLPEAQTFEESLTVAITNNEAGASLYYSTDGVAWTEYTQALTLTETTTVYAKATKNGVDSRTVSATYTKVEPATGVATLAAANGLEDDTNFKFTGDAVVTYHNGKYLFLRDASGYGLIYYDAAPAETFANGVVLNQNWTATKTTYKSLDEFKNPANVSASGVTNSALAAVQTIQASQMADMINAYVKIEHVKSISGTTATLTDGTTIALFNRFTDVTIPEFTDQDCTITGIVSIYNDALQLYFIESDNSGVTPVEGTTYELVTDAASLADGDKIILVNNEASKAMGAAKTNNYGAVDVEIKNNIIVTEDANVITLEAQDNNWALKTNDGYLYAASSSSNHLKAKAEVDSNAIAAINIADNAASIIFQGSNTRNNLRYNKSSVLFSCYASGQEPVYIYKATSNVPTVTVEAPVLSPKHNTKFVGHQVVTITCATEGATIYYTTDSVYQVYTEPFTITETKTVKAYAELNGAKSAIVSAKYYKLTEVSTIAQANELGDKTDFIFYGNVVVVYQDVTSGNLWVKDNTGYGLIYGKQVGAVEVGATLNEEWDAQYHLFRGHINEYQYPNNISASNEPLQTITATEYTEAQLDTTKINERVIVKGLTLTAGEDAKYLYTADGMAIYNQFGITYPTLEEGKTYDVEGMVSYYDNAVQIMPIAVTEAQQSQYQAGDVNKDGKLTISDVTALIAALMSNNFTETDTFSPAAADVDGDTFIKINDVTALISKLMN